VGHHEKKARLFFFFIIIALFGSLILSPFVAAQSVDELILMTEPGPPYNFLADGKIQGISVDTLALMLQKAGSKLTRNDIKIMPWARAYHDTLYTPNTCLFSTTRTEERESLFKWVGPFGNFKIVLIAKKSRGIKINTVKELNDYKIGVINEDVTAQMLVSMGVNKEALNKVASNLYNLKMLEIGRIDLWGYGENVAKWEMKTFGFNPDDYETVFVLLTKELYYAFHKSTSDELIQKLQTILDQLKKDGEHQKILDRYLK